MFQSSTIIRELALNLAKVIFILKHSVKLRYYYYYYYFIIVVIVVIMRVLYAVHSTQHTTHTPFHDMLPHNRTIMT